MRIEKRVEKAQDEEQLTQCFLDKMNSALVDMDIQLTSCNSPRTEVKNTKSILPKKEEIYENSTILEIHEILEILN